MIAIFLAPFYILFNIYICRWLILWMSACHRHFQKRWIRVVVIVIYIFVSSSLLTSFLLPESGIKRALKLLSNYWLGTLLYIALTIIIADVLRIILRHVKRIDQEKLRSKKAFVINGTICLLIIGSLSVYGICNAHYIRTTNYDVTIEKDGGDFDELNVALIADLHMGYSIGISHIEQMVEKVNAMDPDIVLIAGDIFDNEYDALEDPERLAEILRGLKSRYGVYACYGNHDIQEKILAGFTFHSDAKKQSDLRMDALLEEANIQLVRDDTLLIEDSFYLAIRPDYERPGRDITTRRSAEEITSDLNEDLPIIVMEHEPRELQELADAGVDLHLAGHTHDGQMWPGTWTIHLLWENPYGSLMKDDMESIVTSGVGVFGPFMRVNSISEVCQINITFAE